MLISPQGAADYELIRSLPTRWLLALVVNKLLTHDALYLWPMLLSVVDWMTVVHFPGVSLGSINENYNVTKIMCLEFNQTLVHTPVYLLF